MLPVQVSNPGPLIYVADALPIALRGPASATTQEEAKTALVATGVAGGLAALWLSSR